MAAASALRGAQVFGQCGVDPPRFPDRLGSMDLFEAWQGAAQAVQQLDAAVGSLPEQAGLQGTMQSCSGHFASQSYLRVLMQCPWKAAFLSDGKPSDITARILFVKQTKCDV
jgi:hypothetical protein